MAQVKKYQSGGGILRIDGKSYNWNDIKDQYISWASSLPEELRSAASDLQTALTNGGDLSYDSVARVLGGNIDWSYKNTRQQRRTDKGKWTPQTGFVYELSNFKPTQPKAAVDTYDYSKQYDLPDSYIDTPQMHNIIRRLESFKDIASYDKNAKFVGYNGLTRNDYEAWYERNKEKLPELISRIRNNTLTSTDKDILKAFGINSAKSTDDSKQTKALSKYTTIGENGEITLNNEFLQAYPELGNAIFNDRFENQALRSGSGLEWLSGYIKVGNKLYPISDLDDPKSYIYGVLNSPGGFVESNKNGQHSTAESLFKYQWGYPDEWTSYNPEDFWHPVFDQIGNVRFRSRTGQVQAPRDSQVWEVATDEYDKYGLPKTLLYQINPDGTYEVLDNNTAIDYMQEALSPQLYQRITDEGLYKGFIQKDIQDQSGQIGATLFYNPETNELIYHSDQLHADSWPGLKAYDDSRSIKFSDKFGPQIRDLLLKYPQILGRILQSSSDSENWNRIITSPFITAFGDRFRLSHNPALSADVYSQMSDAEIAEIKRLLEEYTGTKENSWLTDKKLWAKDARRWIVPRYVVSQQFGGTAPQIQVIDNTEKIEDLQKASEVGGSKTGWNLTTADKMQIASIVGDVASMVASIPTGGGNPVAAALGLGATGTQFAADVKRDGLDLGDVGTLLFGLGMDIATVIPGLGAAAKSAKLIKQLSKVGKILKTGLTVVGATSAISALDSILSGKGDLNDWKVLSTGMLALPGITRSVKAVATTKYKGGTKKMSFDELAAARKKEVIDKAITDNPELTVYEGQPVEWFDPATKTVTDYDKAAAGLGRNGLFTKWWDKFKTSEEWLGQLFSNKWNPLSKNFALRMSNRELKPEVLTTLHTKSPFTNRVVGNLAIDNPHIARQINAIPGYQAPTQYLVGRHTGPWWYRTYDFTNRAPLALPVAPVNRPVPYRSYSKMPREVDNLSIRSGAYEQMLRDAVLRRPEFGYFKGSPTHWYNNGQITNMPDAISGLSTDPAFHNWMRANIYKYQEGGTAKAEKKNKTVGRNKKDSLEDFITPTKLGYDLAGLTNFFILKKEAENTRDIQKETADTVKQLQIRPPVKEYYKPTIGDLHTQQANRAADTLRNNINSMGKLPDSKIDRVMKLDAEGRINDSLRDAAIKDALERNSINSDNLLEKRKYANAEAQRMAANATIEAQAEAMKGKADELEVGKNALLFNQVMHEQRSKFAKDEAAYREAAFAIETENIKQPINAYKATKKQEWDALTEEERTKLGSFDNWLANDVQYTKLVNEMQKQLMDLTVKYKYQTNMASLYPLPDLKYSYPLPGPKVATGTTHTFKKGGKYRPVAEQRYLDASKSAEKAIAKLKDEVFKILLQALK